MILDLALTIVLYLGIPLLIRKFSKSVWTKKKRRLVVFCNAAVVYLLFAVLYLTMGVDTAPNMTAAVIWSLLALYILKHWNPNMNDSQNVKLNPDVYDSEMNFKAKGKKQQKNLDAILSSIISDNENPSDLDLLACQTIFYCKYVYNNPSSTFLFGGRYASVSTIMFLCVQVCEHFLSGSNEPLSAKYKKDYANKVLLGCSSLYGLSFDELKKVYAERLPYLSHKIGTDAQSPTLVAFRRILEVEFYQSGFYSLTGTNTKNYFYNHAAQTNCTNEILSFYRTAFIDNAFCDLDKKLIARVQEQLNDKVIESHNNYEKDTEDIIIQDNDIPSSADFYNTSKQYNSTEKNIKTKRNLKKISPRALFVSVLLLFCFSIVGNIVFCIENHTLKEENNSLFEKYQQAEEDKNEYKQKNFYSEAKLEKIYDEYEFYHKYAVITTTTGYRYHKYDCYHLNNDNGFYIFNIENAAHQGYTPCLDCLGSGSTEEIKDKLERDLY